MVLKREATDYVKLHGHGCNLPHRHAVCVNSENLRAITPELQLKKSFGANVALSEYQQ